MKVAIVNGQFAPVITCKGQHIPVERLHVFLRQHLSSYRMDRTGKRASWGRASLVAFLSIAFISLALALASSMQASAQDTGNASATQPANPPASAESSDASQSAPSQGKDIPPQPESGWYNPALSAKLSTMGIKNWGILSPRFGDVLLGDAGGIRSKLADHGIAGTIATIGIGWQNLLSEPASTDGMQAYIGQKFTCEGVEEDFITYDLGHIGLKGAQISLDAAAFLTSDINLGPRGFRVIDLSLYYPFLGGKIELSAGYVANDFHFVDTYFSGNTTTSSFGPTASLPTQAGLSNGSADGAPGLNVKSHLTNNWYDKIGVLRSLYPQEKGAVTDWSEINRYGVTFSEPFAKALVIGELGFNRPASTNNLSSFFRGGGLYNWSDYTNFNTGKFSPNWMVYLLGDQQLTRTSHSEVCTGGSASWIRRQT